MNITKKVNEWVLTMTIDYDVIVSANKQISDQFEIMYITRGESGQTRLSEKKYILCKSITVIYRSFFF